MLERTEKLSVPETTYAKELLKGRAKKGKSLNCI